MNRFKTLLCATALAAFGVGAAHAGSVFTDNFNSENGGVGAAPYHTFANFDVTVGSVSLVRNGDLGVQCVGGAGSCVNLGGHRDGPINDNLQSKTGLAYNRGAVVTLTYDISGNQRACCATDDYLETGFKLAGATSLDHFTVDGFDEGTVAVPGTSILDGTGFPLASDDPWTTHTISFVATEAGTAKADFLSYSHDGTGPVLDNVGLSVSGGVPEPASWALMVLGVGGVGAMVRRRVGAPALA